MTGNGTHSTHRKIIQYINIQFEWVPFAYMYNALHIKDETFKFSSFFSALHYTRLHTQNLCVCFSMCLFTSVVFPWLHDKMKSITSQYIFILTNLRIVCPSINPHSSTQEMRFPSFIHSFKSTSNRFCVDTINITCVFVRANIRHCINFSIVCIRKINDVIITNNAAKIAHDMTWYFIIDVNLLCCRRLAQRMNKPYF